MNIIMDAAVALFICGAIVSSILLEQLLWDSTLVGHNYESLLKFNLLIMFLSVFGLVVVYG